MSDGWKQTSKTSFLAKSSLVAVVRSLVGLPYEHPLDTVKTVMQSQETTKRASAIVREIYSKSGIKGFYSGVLPNAARIMLKGMYRMPLIVSLPHLVSSSYKRLFNKQLSASLCKTFTGISMAMIEVLVITPAERLKVWLMTHPEANKKSIMFFIKNSDRLGEELFKGLGIMYMKQMISWVSFLLTDQLVKSEFRKRQNLSSTDMLPYWQLLLVSLSVGVVNTIFVQPFDYLKTKIQQKHNCKMSAIETARNTFKTHGFSVFYTGWRVRMVHYMVQSVLTVNIYEILQTNYKRIAHK